MNPCWRPPGARPSSDEGFAAVAGLALAGVLTAFAALIALLAGVAVTRHQAAAIADLAALAAAGHVLEGGPVACDAATKLARAQGAKITHCEVDALDVILVVSVRPVGPLSRWGSVRATARAGPAP